MRRCPVWGLQSPARTGRLGATPIGSNRKSAPMSDPINRHDARALALIDHALNEGRFTAELVEQIREALASASHAETDTHSTT